MDTPSPLPDELVGLAGEEFVLRAYQESDLSHLQSAFADPLIRTYNPGPADEEGADGVRGWMCRRNNWSTGTHLSWAIARPGGELLGAISIYDVSAAHLHGEAGYWIHPDVRGHGWAASALRLGTEWAFRECGLVRVFLHHALENAPSCAVATKAGFTLEGVLQRSYRYGDGVLHDEHLHARVNDH